MSTTAPDSRPKTIAWSALILAIVGVVLSLVGLVPVAIVGVIAVLIGALALAAGFILSIVALASKRQGGTPLSVTALVLTVVGAVISVFALAVSLVFTGLSLAADTSAEPTAPGTQTSAPATDDPQTFTVDEEAFLVAVRPEVARLFLEIDPTLTAPFPDDELIKIGEALLATGEEGIDARVDQTLATAGDALEAAQVRPVYEAIYAAAQAHLE